MAFRFEVEIGQCFAARHRKLKRNDRLVILAEPLADGWVAVRTRDGTLGYVSTEFLKAGEEDMDTEVAISRALIETDGQASAAPGETARQQGADSP